MGLYWYAFNYDTLTYFESPKEFGFNKSYHVHNPKNPFSNMFVYMNEKEDGLGDIYELKNDQYHDILQGKQWSDYTDITEKVYKEYLEFWEDRDEIIPNSKKHYDNLTEEEESIIDNLPAEKEYLRDRPIESNGKENERSRII